MGSTAYFLSRMCRTGMEWSSAVCFNALTNSLLTIQLNN